MIREATAEDIPRLIEMGMRFLQEGPYRDQITRNPRQATRTALRIHNDRGGRIYVADKDGVPIGLVAFFVFTHFFSGEVTAYELMLYVEPEYRNSCEMIGPALLKYAESVALQMGAKWMQLTRPAFEDDRDRVYDVAYRRMGYSPTEIGYMKPLCQ